MVRIKKIANAHRLTENWRTVYSEWTTKRHIELTVHHGVSLLLHPALRTWPSRSLVLRAPTKFRPSDSARRYSTGSLNVRRVRIVLERRTPADLHRRVNRRPAGTLTRPQGPVMTRRPNHDHIDPTPPLLHRYRVPRWSLLSPQLSGPTPRRARVCTREKRSSRHQCSY